jgi:hypothetical protein
MLEAIDDEVTFDEPAAQVGAPIAGGNALVLTKSVSQIQAALAELDKIEAALPELEANHPTDLVFDVTTTKGMAEAVAHRAAWRDPRIAVEKYRKTAKSPALLLGKAIDARAASLTERLEAGELPAHEQIKAEEARRAQEKADREAKEFGRVMAMQEAIAEIAMTAIVAGKTSVEIAARLDTMKATQLDPLVYQEMMPQAQQARIAAIDKLEQGLKAAQWDEAEAARRAAEAEALRIKREAEDAERARVSAAQEAEAKRLQEARDAIAKAEKEAADKLAAERAEFARERAEFKAAQEKAAQELAARDAQQVLKAEPTTADATDRDAPVNTSPSVGSMGAGQPADAVAIEVATLNAGAICKRLGFVLTVDFIIDELGVEPGLREKRATLWSEAGFRMICDRLAIHIAKVRSGEAVAA